MKIPTLDPLLQDVRSLDSPLAVSTEERTWERKTAHPITKRFARGSVLFLQGDECRGVLVLRKGRVKLYADNYAGKSAILAVAGPGQILGLAAAMTGRCFEATAEALEPCEAEFIPRTQLLRRLTNDGDLALQVCTQLSESYFDIRDSLASLSGADPVVVRLARLLEAWTSDRVRTRPGFTHQEIAEIIGTTRETVTRSFRELRCNGIATLKNGELVIHDRHRLALLAANGKCGP